MLAPYYDELILGKKVPGAVDKGSLLETQDGKNLVREMPEWAAWFKWHGLEPPENPEVRMDFDEAKCPSGVVLAPCCKSNWPMKEWPHWNELIAKMPGCTVVGLSEDGGELKGDFVDMRGKTPLRQLAGILADADYVVAEEGGVAHLACSVGTRTYILYGGTDPVKNEPPANSVLLMSSEKFNCRPCQYRSLHKERRGNTTIFHGCRPEAKQGQHTRCMTALNPYEVMKAIADHGDNCIHSDFRRI